MLARADLDGRHYERISRLRRFNVFHENPEMVGREDAEVNAEDQADYFLNMPKEKRDFE